jgi:hypothetical protein
VAIGARVARDKRPGWAGWEVRCGVVVSLAVALTSRKRWGWVVCMYGCAAFFCPSARLMLTSRSSSLLCCVLEKMYAGRKRAVAQVGGRDVFHPFDHDSVRAFGRRCLLSLSLLCDRWLERSLALSSFLVGGLMARRVHEATRVWRAGIFAAHMHVRTRACCTAGR